MVAATAEAGLRQCPWVPVGARRARWVIDQEVGEVPVLRANALSVLQSWGVARDGDQAFAAILILTELVTNAGRHGHPDLGLIDVDMWIDGERITVVVTDGGAGALRPRRASSDDESGRGLELVSAYAEATGCESWFGGKKVWAVICSRPAPGEKVQFLVAPEGGEARNRLR